MSARAVREQVKSLWLGTSEVWDRYAGGWLRTSAEGQECLLRLAAAAGSGHHGGAFRPCSYEGKFALEQPSGTGVGHELASAARSCACCSQLTHKATCKGPSTLMSMTMH